MWIAASICRSRIPVIATVPPSVPLCRIVLIMCFKLKSIVCTLGGRYGCSPMERGRGVAAQGGRSERWRYLTSGESLSGEMHCMQQLSSLVWSMPPFRRRPDRAIGGFIRLDSRAVVDLCFAYCSFCGKQDIHQEGHGTPTPVFRPVSFIFSICSWQSFLTLSKELFSCTSYHY